MKPEQIEFLDQCAAFVTGGLTPQESEVFAKFLAHTDEARRRDYSKLVWAAAHLASIVPQHTPPAHVKDSLMSRIRAEKQKALEQPQEKKKEFYSLREHEGEWFPHPIAAEIKVKVLAINQEAGYATIIIDVPPGVKYPEHHHHGAEECLVLSGDLHVGGDVLGPGDFHHADAHSDHGVLSTIHGGRAVLVVDIEDIL